MPKKNDKEIDKILEDLKNEDPPSKPEQQVNTGTNKSKRSQGQSLHRSQSTSGSENIELPSVIAEPLRVILVVLLAVFTCLYFAVCFVLFMVLLSPVSGWIQLVGSVAWSGAITIFTWLFIINNA